jgi:primosomal protein N' (replication factor Y)
VNRAARVVPDVPSFAVDRGFWYSVPGHLAPDLIVGSIVRVPLSGRRVRGWVVELEEAREGKLKEIAAISGDAPVFDLSLLKGLEWAAGHYVAPVSSLISRATPPNLPRSIPPPGRPVTTNGPDHPMARYAGEAAQGHKTPVSALVGNWRSRQWLTSLAPALNAGRSVLVVAASVAEVREVAASSAAKLGRVLALVDGEDAAAETKAWQAAQSAPRLVIGTPKTATWKVANLGLAVVLEEGRRAMKDRQTPTIHVREVLTVRSRIEGFNLVFFGPTPSVELLSAGAEVIKAGNRAWPLVEVVDRSEEQPGSGFLSDRAMSAISATALAGNRVFVYTHRRAGLASMRCMRCRSLRSCPSCGARTGRDQTCHRCHAVIGPCRRCGGNEFEAMGTIPERLVAEINRRAGARLALTSPDDALVTVGTERDLAGLGRVALAVAADVDGMLVGGGYRSTEEALRQLARLALSVTGDKGTRLMLQTSRPGSLLVTTMRRGDPIPYLERVLVERARDGAPPATDMIALEIRGNVPGTVDDDLRQLGSRPVVMGPLSVEAGKRWLLTGQLGKTRLELRELVGGWREAGATVRVDVDPIDV